MKSQASMHVARLGHLVVIARGDNAIHFDSSDVPALIRALATIQIGMDADGAPLPGVQVVTEVAEVGPSVQVELPQELLEEPPQEEPTPEVPQEVPQVSTQDPPEEPAKAPPRGNLWDAVRAHLSASPRAQSRDSIWQAVGGQAKSPQSLAVVLGRRVRLGDLAVSPSGRYRLER